VNDIWDYTKRAKIILADLSGKNPNVFYELGLAHALAKPAILVTESMDDVPFDLRALRVLIYNKNSPSWGEKLKQAIVQSVKEISETPTNAVLPTFLTVKQENKSATISEQEKTFLELKRDLDLLRQEFSHSVTTPSDEVSERRKRQSIISAREAEDRIRDYIRRNFPEHLIYERLIALGAPGPWIERTIRLQKRALVNRRKRSKNVTPARKPA
jgi:hypothetical protein